MLRRKSFPLPVYGLSTIYLNFSAFATVTNMMSIEQLGRAIVDLRNVEEVKKCLSRGVNPNAMYRDKDPLYWCIHVGHLQIAEMVIEAGANTCKHQYDGTIPLCQAVSRRNIPLIKLLLENGAKFTLHDGLVTAVQNQHLEIVQELINLGANVNNHNSQFEYPIICAVRKGNLAILKLLVETGADLNIQDSTGDTPLIAAVRTMNVPIVKYLLENNVDLNRKTGIDETALSISLHLQDFRTFELLIEAGADRTLAKESIDEMTKINPCLAAYMLEVQQRNPNEAQTAGFSAQEAAST